MDPHYSDPPPAAPLLQRMAAAWDRFWFTSADPTTLALIRICTGVVMTYTMIAFTLDLQELLGPQGWLDLETRNEMRYSEPVSGEALGWTEGEPPRTESQRRYFAEYLQKHGVWPPAYPQTKEEEDEIDAYIARWGIDPRRVAAHGRPAWSIWFHVTDPGAMLAVQWGFVLATLLFTLGCGGRLTAGLAWAGTLCYVHRTPVCLFGVDTMAAVLMLYLLIGPSSAALSVDRLLAHWWAKARVDVINRWRAFWARGGAAPAPVMPGTWSELPTPSVSANVAIRLLQVHLCVIYLSAGLSKLQGVSWWTGDAVWGTIVNFEFAPVQSPVYLWVMNLIAGNRVVFAVVMTTAALMTLAFEISYSYLIWRRSTRPILLTVAMMLHGSIALFMGLKTFSLLMMTFNMAFVAPETVRWGLRKLSGGRYGQDGTAAPPPPPPEQPVKTTAIKAEKPMKHFVGAVKRKH
jgi:hypothetical protein